MAIRAFPRGSTDIKETDIMRYIWGVLGATIAGAMVSSQIAPPWATLMTFVIVFAVVSRPAPK